MPLRTDKLAVESTEAKPKRGKVDHGSGVDHLDMSYGSHSPSLPSGSKV